MRRRDLRLAGLPIKIQPDEIVLVVKEAVELSFMYVKIHFLLCPDEDCIHTIGIP